MAARYTSVRDVVRKSNGEMVRLCLARVPQNRNLVVIDIPQPPYNSRFTFTVHENGRWVKLNKRQVLDKHCGTYQLHVSQTVFYGMAVWSCAILRAERFRDPHKKMVVTVEEALAELSTEWDVYLKSDTGESCIARVTAPTYQRAVILGWTEFSEGDFSEIIGANLSAKPLACHW